jgi:hypothetical protein
MSRRRPSRPVPRPVREGRPRARTRDVGAELHEVQSRRALDKRARRDSRPLGSSPAGAARRPRGLVPHVIRRLVAACDHVHHRRLAASRGLGSDAAPFAPGDRSVTLPPFPQPESGGRRLDTDLTSSAKRALVEVPELRISRSDRKHVDPHGAAACPSRDGTPGPQSEQDHRTSGEREAHSEQGRRQMWIREVEPLHVGLRVR